MVKKVAKKQAAGGAVKKPTKQKKARPVSRHHMSPRKIKKKAMHGLMKPIKLRSQAKIIPMEVRKQRNRDVILIFDFGSQYTQLVARRVRESKVFSQIVPYNITAEQVK